MFVIVHVVKTKYSGRHISRIMFFKKTNRIKLKMKQVSKVSYTEIALMVLIHACVIVGGKNNNASKYNPLMI